MAAYVFFAALGIARAVPAVASPIVVESGSVDGYDVGDAVVGWTQTTGFSGFDVSASLEQVGNIVYPPPNYNPTQVNSIGPLTAYITTAIGPTATGDDVVATSTQTIPLYFSSDQSGLVTLFSGLTLQAGSYYLVIQTPIDTFVDYSRTAYTLGQGITNVTNAFGENGLSFEPSDTFDPYSSQEPTGSFLVSITGTPLSSTTTVPEPTTLGLFGLGLLSVVAARRRR
jgi:hypothetical protein